MRRSAFVFSKCLNFSFGFWRYFCGYGSDGKESACNAGDVGDVGLIPGSGRSPWEGNSNSLHYSCLEVNIFFMFSIWNYLVSLGICRGLVSESNMVAKFHKCSSPLYKMNLWVWRVDYYETQYVFWNFTHFSPYSPISPQWEWESLLWLTLIWSCDIKFQLWI